MIGEKRGQGLREGLPVFHRVVPVFFVRIVAVWVDPALPAPKYGAGSRSRGPGVATASLFSDLVWAPHICNTLCGRRVRSTAAQNLVFEHCGR